jgi:aspartyl-tRNA(Asn)/glutamyl-tRNA(Gln) amidotransferase subunit A
MRDETTAADKLPSTAGAALSALEKGDITASVLVNCILARIAAPGSEGARAFLSVVAEGAMAAAGVADRQRNEGCSGPLAGLPVAVKDLFDIEGQVTTAGSRILAKTKPAGKDAATVALLRQAGAVILGRTHMNEFAYSGLGTNPHLPQPRAPWQREVDGGRGRSPGGSTSGGAVAVADGLAYVALGSDTGGSTRVPAAFCGVTGWRPSQGRMPAGGTFPLAKSSDTPGLIVRSVADCRLLDAVLTHATVNDEPDPQLDSLRLGVATGMPLEDLDPVVSDMIHRTIEHLGRLGAQIGPCPAFDWAEPSAALRSGQVTAVEALVAHGALFDRKNEYDQRVVTRMRAGESIAATDYVRAQRRIAGARHAFDAAFAAFDAILMPTVAILPPRLADLDDDDAFFACNAAALRNTLIASILDLPAISLPLSAPDAPPVGLMMVGRRGDDRWLLAAAQAVEAALAGRRGD